MTDFLWIFLIIFVGLVVNWLIGFFTKSSTLQPTSSFMLGIAGSIAGGFLLLRLSVRLFGEGPERFVSLLGAAIGAALLVLPFRLINR